ncbi:MAG: terminase family protein [Ignavibacteriaceae bacterium]
MGRINNIKFGIIAQPGGQKNFLESSCFEVLYGGAAGPGKTWALAIDALGLQFKKKRIKKYAIEIPGYRGVLFRRQSTQLADIIEECAKYYPIFGGRYLAGRKGDPGASFSFPVRYEKMSTIYKNPGGARIYLCHLNNERDKENHQGFEYQFVGFDELTQFLFSQYIYLFSRCRSTIPGLYPRVKATTNPIGIGLGWVKKRFRPQIVEKDRKFFIADPTDHKNYRGIEVPRGTKHALSRHFIPGRLAENKILMRTDSEYISRIKAMGPKYSKALLDSDWDVMEGQFFDIWSPDVHIVKKEFYLDWRDINNFNVIGGLDYGNIMALHLLLKDCNNNVLIIDELSSIGETRDKRVMRIKDFLKVRGLEKIPVVADTNMWAPEAFDMNQREFPAQAFMNAGINLIKVSKRSVDNYHYRVACNVAIKNALYYEVSETGLITMQPRLKIYERCKKFIETFPALPVDEDDPEDIQGHGNEQSVEDHWYDAAKMAYMVISETIKQDINNKPKWLKEMDEANNKTDFMAQ